MLHPSPAHAKPAAELPPAAGRVRVPPQSCGVGGAARPRQKNELQKNTKKVSEMHRKRPRAGVLSPHPLCRQKVLSSASSSAGKGEVGGEKKEGVTPPAPRHVSVQGGVSAPAPRARGSGRCRCTRDGPSCSAPAAPPAGRCPRRHPLGTGERGHSGALVEVGDTEATQGGFWRSPQAGRGPSVPLSLLSSRLPVKERLRVATPKCPTPQSEGSEDHTPHPKSSPPPPRFPPAVRCSDSSASPHLQEEGLDGVAVLVVGEAPQEEALLIALFLQTLQRSGRQKGRAGGGQRAQGGTRRRSHEARLHPPPRCPPQPPPLGSTHVDAEVLGGAGDDPLGREGSGDVLQRDGRGADGAGEPDDGEALRAAEGPAVPGVDIWLRGREGERQPFRYQQPYPMLAVGFLPTNTPLKPPQGHPGAHLQDDPRGLRLVPQGDPEQAEQRRLRLVGFGAAGVDHAGP